MNKSIVKRLVDQAIARSRQPKPVKKVEYKTYKDFNLKSPYDWDIAGVAITYANDVRKWYDLFDFRGEFVFGGAIHYDTRKIRQDLFFMIVHDRDLNIKTRLKYQSDAIKSGFKYDNEPLLQKGVYPYEDEK